MSEKTTNRKTGFTKKQYALLLIAFIMGIASVYTLDKTLLAKDPPTNVAQAAIVK